MPAFTKVNSSLRSTQVRQHLETAIERGDYKPGDRLPSERELTEIFGVSRVSVREAISSLEAVGLVEVRHGNGCFVTEPGAGRGDRWLALHQDEALELLTVRGALDEVAAREAAHRAGAAQGSDVVAGIRAAHEAFATAEEAGAPVEELSALDVAFHMSIAEASGSPLLADLLRDLHRHSADASRAQAYVLAGRAEMSAREHAAILDAIEAGHVVGAGAAAAAHVQRVSAFLTTTLEEAGAGSDGS
jgi:DNA-binding FadR family transcriptional regulator